MELNTNRESQAEYLRQVQLKRFMEYANKGTAGPANAFYPNYIGGCPYCHRCPTCGRGGDWYNPNVIYCNSHATQAQPTAGYQITYAVN